MDHTNKKKRQEEVNQNDKNYKWRIWIKDFQKASKQKLDQSVYGYFSAGSDDEVTLRNNKNAFKKITIYPRVLVDMSSINMRTRILGRQVDIPFGVAPIAMQKLIHPEGQVLAAKEAFLQNTAYGLSMLSTTRPSQVASVNPSGLKIHQLYLLKNAQYTKEFIKMVAKSGFNALALTVDTQTFGKRRVDKRNNFTPSVTLQVFKQLDVDILFDSPESPEKSFIQSINTRVTWQDVKQLKKLSDQYNLKIILKGVNDQKDIEFADKIGVNAIWISNHGGRQLDTCPASVQMILPMRRQLNRINSKMQLYVDGGIEKGTDIFKCLALGADFVFVGRGFLYSLIDGSSGIHQAFQILKSQFKTTMMLTGTRNIKQINQNYVIYKQPYSKL